MRWIKALGQGARQSVHMPDYMPLFTDRKDAGRQLALRLKALDLADPVVYALPRGGVPLAVEIARTLKAPLDLVLVRKIGAPGQAEFALAAVVDGEDAQTVVNVEAEAFAGSEAGYFAKARARELDEIERRRTLYFGGRPRVSPAGRTAIVVDDGLATGATAKAALRALKRQGAAKVILAVPVAPAETLAEMQPEADIIVCLHAPQRFRGVGAFYGDFHQLTDEETLRLLRQAWETPAPGRAVKQRRVRLPPLALTGDLQMPDDARGIVLFAHGSGSSRLSPRNRAVADALNARGFATLLFDLLSDTEAQDRGKVFDVHLLADRLRAAAPGSTGSPTSPAFPLACLGQAPARRRLSRRRPLGARVRPSCRAAGDLILQARH